MTRAARESLLRKRAAARLIVPLSDQKWGIGLHRAVNPGPGASRRRRTYWTYPKEWGFVAYGPMLAHKPQLWLMTPDQPEDNKAHLSKPKRRTGVPALVRMAEKLLRKRKRGEHSWWAKS